MNEMIHLIIWAFIFIAVGYGLCWGVKKFEMPQPALWIVGGLWIILVLLAISGQLPLPRFFR